jgi:hypothetical protein
MNMLRLCRFGWTTQRVIRWPSLLLLAVAAAWGCSSDEGSAPSPAVKQPIPLRFVNVAPKQLPATAAHGLAVALADLDKDGRADLVQATRDGLRLFWNRGGGKYEAAAATAIPAQPEGYAVQPVAADFDGDGRTDLFLLVNGAPHRMLLNKGGGAMLEGPVPGGTATDGLMAAAADLDGDKDIDVVAVVDPGDPAGSPVRVLINDGKGKLTDETAKRLTGVGLAPNGVALGDVDGDGAVDVLFTGAAENRLYLNDGKGMLRDAPPDAIPSMTQPSTRAAAIGDLDGDGAADIFLCSDKQSIVLMNDGTGRFLDQTPYVMGPNAGPATAALIVDLDRDDARDLVVTSAKGRFVIYRNDGAGRLFDYSSSLAPASPAVSDTVAVAAADLDGDGDQDLFVSRTNTARPWLLLNQQPAKLVDGDGDGMPDELDVCPEKSDPEQANHDAWHFSCSDGTSCMAATGCELAIWKGTEAFLLCRKDPKPWAEARAFCKQRGGDLVVVTSKDQNTFLAAQGMTEAFLGASDTATEGTWTWVTDDALTYKNWNTGEPSDTTGAENCVAMYGDGELAGKWNDVPCDAPKQFICQDKMERSPADPGDACDNCPSVHNPDQKDTDKNGKGDACEK